LLSDRTENAPIILRNCRYKNNLPRLFANAS
jgi:hypothetical protein